VLWRGGSVTHLMSSEQDDDVFEGSVFDYAWFDEPLRRAIYIAIKRGFLTTGGHLWWTLTPLSEPWIYDELYLPGKAGKDEHVEIFEDTGEVNPYQAPEDTAEFISRLDDDEVDARVHGKFKHLRGRVFKKYDPDRHRVPSFNVPDHWPVWCSIDPHLNKPHAVLFMTVSPQQKKYVCNEIYKTCSMKKLAEDIYDVGAQYRLANILIDTSAQIKGWDKTSARTILHEEWRALGCGWRTKLAQKKNLKTSGIHLINQDFADDELFIMAHCTRTHRELRNQVYKKNKRDEQVKLSEPEKKWDEMTDNMRYVMVEKPKHEGISKPKQAVVGLYNRS